MKDTEYLRLAKSVGVECYQRLKHLKTRVLPFKGMSSIHEAVLDPKSCFEALKMYDVQSGSDKIPMDDLAYSVASVIIHSGFFRGSAVGRAWLQEFDRYYLEALGRMIATKQLQAKTVEVYRNKIRRIQEEVWDCDKPVEMKTCDRLIYTILHNPERYFECLERYASMTKGRISSEGRGVRQGLGQHSKDGFTSAMVALFLHNEALRLNHDALYKRWLEGQKLLRAPIQDKYLTNKPTPRQQAAYVTFENVVKKRDSLEDGSPERLLLTFYTDIPPNRSDFYDTRIYRSVPNPAPKDSNYVVLLKNKGTLVMNKYKTAKTYGQNVIELPEESLRQLRISLEKEPREYLFISRRFKKPYNKLKDAVGSFNSWANGVLKGLFNEDMSLTMLRHIYISRPDLNLREKSGTERDVLARKMGHSVRRQDMYSWHAFDPETDRGPKKGEEKKSD